MRIILILEYFLNRSIFKIKADWQNKNHSASFYLDQKSFFSEHTSLKSGKSSATKSRPHSFTQPCATSFS